jgi:hypothetical protein
LTIFLAALYIGCGGRSSLGLDVVDYAGGAGGNWGAVTSSSGAQNTGGAAPACGELPSGSECGTVLATGQDAPFRIVVANGTAYWTNAGNVGFSTVQKVSTQGGPVTIVASSQYGPNGITADSANVYWANAVYPGGIVKAPLAGGTPVSVVDNTETVSIVIHGPYIYWTAPNEGAIWRQKLPNGTPETLAVNQAVPIEIAANGSGIYWTNTASGEIMKLLFDDTVAVQLAVDAPGVESIAVDAVNAYWTNWKTGTVTRVALTGGTPIVVASNQPQPDGIAVDDLHVYWSNSGHIGKDNDGTIMRARIDGGAITALAVHQVYPSGVAVDAHDVYWTDVDGGTIKKIRKNISCPCGAPPQ